MFCLRAISSLVWVGVCAYVGGCAVQAPPTEASRNAAPAVADSAIVVSAPVHVISADMPNAAVLSVSSEDIINWSIRGISDDLIIDRIEHSNAPFHLSASEEIHLRDAGVSNEVIRAMKAGAS